jgi:hypothetical protein
MPMSRWIFVGLFLLSLFAAGCGSEKERNQNRDKDRPRSTDKAEPVKPKG